MNQNRYPETEPHIYQNLECDNDDIQNYWKGIILNDIETTSYSFGKVEFLGGSDDKESACIARDPGLIPRSGRSPGEGNGNSLQYSCLENSMDISA